MDEDQALLYDKTMMPVIAEDLRIFNENDIPRISLPENQIRLYIATEMSEEFFASGDITPQQFGRTVYCFKFHIP